MFLPLNEFPPSIKRYFVFQILNFMALPLFAGVPLWLFVKALSDSDMVLGIIAAIPPLTVLLQLPTALMIHFFGYRRLLLRCWLMSLAPMGVLILVPLLPGHIDGSAKIGVIILCLFVFHGLRAIGATGVWAWVMQLIPENQRGKMLSIEQMVVALAGLILMILFALIVPDKPGPWFFVGIFIFGWILLILSYQQARIIPDVPVERPASSGGKVPWGTMITYRPFQRLLIFSATFFVGFSAISVFWMPVVKDILMVGDTQIFIMMAVGSVFSIISMFVLGKKIDIVGSRPVIHFCVGIVIIHCFVWFAIASRLIPFNYITIILIQATSGFALPGFSMAIIRLLMKTAPEMGRSHFFAIFNVVNSLIMGCLPILWGMALDTFGESIWHIYEGEINRYSLMYLVTAIIFFISLIMARRLYEDEALGEDAFFNQLVIQTPLRAWSRFSDWVYALF